MKHALITGGSNGIGKELVYRFANSGAKVSFIYNKSIEKAEAIVKDLKDFYGINVNAFQCSIYNHRTTKTNQKYPSVNL